MVVVDVPNGPIVKRIGGSSAPPGSYGKVMKIQVGLSAISLEQDATVYLYIKWDESFPDISAGGWFAHTFVRENGEPYISGSLISKIEAMTDEFEVQMALVALLAKDQNKEE